MNCCLIITDMDQICVWAGNISEAAFGRAYWACELAPEHTGENQKGEQHASKWWLWLALGLPQNEAGGNTKIEAQSHIRPCSPAQAAFQFNSPAFLSEPPQTGCQIPISAAPPVMLEDFCLYCQQDQVLAQRQPQFSSLDSSNSLTNLVSFLETRGWFNSAI